MCVSVCECDREESFGDHSPCSSSEIGLFDLLITALGLLLTPLRNDVSTLVHFYRSASIEKKDFS